MPTPAVVTDKTASWRADIQRYLITVQAAADVLAAYSDGRRPRYRVLVVAPEISSPEALWGPAVAHVLEHDGIQVTLTHIDALPREQFEGQLRDADSIVMLVTTESVALECIDAVSLFKQGLLVCFPKENMGGHTYSVLSRHGLDILPFSRLQLESGNACPLGTHIFMRLSDRVTIKSTEETRRLRMQETMVVLVHGILSLGIWRDQIKNEFKANGLLAESTDAGLVQLPAFLLPFRWIRDRPVNKVRRDIEAIKNANAKCRISILAHSFGTFIVSRLFEREDQFSVERMAFCGSIAPDGSAFPIGSARCVEIVNEVGSQDFWPALAHSITWGYGRSGTYGFQSPGIEDRWHDSLGHRGFLTREFCKKFWVPYFDDGTVVAADEAKPPPLLIRAVTLVPIRWILLLGALGCVVWGLSKAVFDFFR